MIEINGVGRRVHYWQRTVLGATDVETALALCEEAGEVARVILKTSLGIRPNTRGDLAEEIGDVLLCVLSLASRGGVNAEQALSDRLDRLEGLTREDLAE